jgi:hypothetical protein
MLAGFNGAGMRHIFLSAASCCSGLVSLDSGTASFFLDPRRIQGAKAQSNGGLTITAFGKSVPSHCLINPGHVVQIARLRV